ncbi:hypothetical protein CHU98_g12623 [Xylaria longipes]|nr:hypothetical protein CHU98_g12623 [Xylaria longipes]
MAYLRRDSYCSVVNTGAGSPLISDRSNIQFDAELLQFQLNRLQRSISDLSLRLRVDETIGRTPPDPSHYENETSWDQVQTRPSSPLAIGIETPWGVEPFEVPSSLWDLEKDTDRDKASIATDEWEDVPEAYKYQSLNPDQFRLLAIYKPHHSSGMNAPIECSLHTYSFRHTYPKYRAPAPHIVKVILD